MVRRNGILGYTDDTLLATFSGGSGTWQTLSATLAAAGAAGNFEVYVDCDGTAGNIFVDTLSVTGASTKNPGAMPFWLDGLALAQVSTAGGGSGSGGGISRSRVLGGGVG
jgi:hypothetical protein